MKILKTLFITALLIAMVRPIHADNLNVDAQPSMTMFDDYLFEDVSFDYDAQLSKEVLRLNGETMTYDMGSASGSFTGILMDFDMFMSFTMEMYADDVIKNFESDELQLTHVEVSMYDNDELLFKRKLEVNDFFEMDEMLRLPESVYEFHFRYYFEEVSHHYYVDLFMADGVKEEMVRMFEETISVDERHVTIRKEVLLEQLKQFQEDLKIESIYLNNLVDGMEMVDKRIYNLSELPEEIVLKEYVSSHSDIRWHRPTIFVNFINDEQQYIKPKDEKGLYSFELLDDWTRPSQGLLEVDALSPLKAGLDVTEIRFIAPAINVDQNTTPMNTIKHVVIENREDYWIDVQQFHPIQLGVSETIEQNLLRTVVGITTWYERLTSEDYKALGVPEFQSKYTHDDLFSYQLIYDEKLDKTYIYTNAMEDGYRLGLYDTLDGDYVSTKKDIPKGIIPHYGVDIKDDVLEEVKRPNDLDTVHNSLNESDLSKQDETSKLIIQDDVSPYTEVNTGILHPETYYVSLLALLSSVLAWLLKKY